MCGDQGGEPRSEEGRNTTKKRGQHLSFTTEEKAQVVRYASTNGVRAAVRHFSMKFGKDLKENAVRDWVKVYNKELVLRQTLEMTQW